MRKELSLSSEEESNDKENDENGEASVGVFHPGDQKTCIDLEFGS
jgi:hypothetical protein